MKRFVSIFLFAAIMVFATMPQTAFAASSSVTIAGGDSVKVGDTITMTVTYKGASIGFVNGDLTYDNDKLTYISGGSSTGDAGLVQLKTYTTDASGKIIFKLKFKGAKPGVINLKVNTIETQNINGDKDLGTPSVTKAIEILAADKATTEVTTTEPKTSDISQETSKPTEPSDVVEVQKDADYSIVWIVLGIVLVGAIGLVIWLIKRKKKKV